MDPFRRADLQRLVTADNDLCVSIFTQTHPGGDEASRIRVKHQLHDAGAMLHGRGVRNAAEWLKPAITLTDSDKFWKSSSTGLAIFVSGERLQLYRLPLSFANEVFVGSHFHVKPILPWFAEDERFYVLAISQNHVRLLEGASHGARPIALKHAPANFKESQQTHDRDEVLNVHTHPASIGRHVESIFHGHGVGIDDHKTELGQYMHKIDQALCHTIGETRAPVVLATVSYLAAIYRAHSHYPQLTEQNVAGNPDHLSDAELHDKAWPLVEGLHRAGEERMIAHFARLKAANRTADTLVEVLPAAHRGEIETLLLAPGRSVWGKFDPAANVVEEHKAPQPNDDELTNLTAVHALRHHRPVVVLKGRPPFGDAPLAGMFFAPRQQYSVTG